MITATYFVFGVVVAIVLISMIANRVHQGQLRNQSGISREEFERLFEQKGIPRAISLVVYEHFKKISSFKDFSPSPHHSLDDTYWIRDAEDFEDELKEMLHKAGLEEPSSATVDEWNGEAVKTVGDVVELINWISQKQKEQEKQNVQSSL